MTDEPIFIPPEDEPLSPEEELQGLEDAFGEDLAEEGDELVVAVAEPPPIGKGWAFDFITNGGQFITAGGRGPLETRGDRTLYYWIEKALRTDRGAHPIYSASYGMERPFDMIGRHLNSADYADLENRIHQALTFHPRIVGIAEFSAEQDPSDEVLYVSFRVLKDDDSSLDVGRVPLNVLAGA